MENPKFPEESEKKGYRLQLPLPPWNERNVHRVSKGTIFKKRSRLGIGFQALHIFVQPYSTSWWFQRFYIFTLTLENDPTWRAYFSNGWLNHQLVNHFKRLKWDFFLGSVLSGRAFRHGLAIAVGSAALLGEKPPTNHGCFFFGPGGCGAVNFWW